MTPEPDEALRLAAVADRIRTTLESWPDVSRPHALAGCLVMLGSEAGYEAAHDRAKFLEYAHELLAWAFDMGALVAADKKGRGS